MPFKDDVRAISRAHVQQAATEIDKVGIPKRRRSTKWAVKIENRLYPPNYLLSVACRIATGRSISPIDHSGGDQTNGVFRALEFEIMPAPLGSNTKEV